MTRKIFTLEFNNDLLHVGNNNSGENSWMLVISNKVGIRGWQKSDVIKYGWGGRE